MAERFKQLLGNNTRAGGDNAIGNCIDSGDYYKRAVERVDAVLHFGIEYQPQPFPHGVFLSVFDRVYTQSDIEPLRAGWGLSRSELLVVLGSGLWESRWLTTG